MMNFYHSCFYRSTRSLLLQTGVVMVVCWGDAMAGLGQSPLPGAQASAVRPPMASVPQSEFGAKAQASPRPAGYTVHESGLETGTTVTEYATTGGVVFAVHWRGPVLPDLDGLLGTYFAAFRTQAQQARAAGRRGSPMTVVTDSLVVNSTGRMRNFAGWAYAPGLVPTDVAIKDVLQ
jgi:Protein of unknown function (DUF2844)